MAPEVVIQNPDRPSAILDALESIAGPDTTRFRAAAAYTSLRGCRELTHRISAAVGDDRWTHTPKLLITCFEFFYTEPLALQFLADLSESQVMIASAETGHFHPKVYIFDQDDRRHFMIGSPNLTGRALADNTEMAVVIRDAPGDAIDPFWEEIESQAQVLTPARLLQYTEDWEQRDRTREIDPPLENDYRSGSLPAFTRATVDYELQDWSNFWIEAGSMSSGGSNNQLELPRGAARFFGYDFADYSDERVTIGSIELVARDRRWSRTLAWHGDNRMERLYLPTVAQGAFDYQDGKAIRFKRLDEGFRLIVADWNSDTATSWREASAVTGTLFLVGSISTSRVCGLF